MWKEVAFLFFLWWFFCCCFVCFWFFVSSPSLAVTGSSTGGADLKERWYLLKRTSECVSTLFPEACIWCSKIGVHCNLKITKCSLWRSWQESSATKTALFSKGKALIKKKKKMWTNSDMLNMTFFFCLFYSYWATTRLSENNCKTCWEMCWNYVFLLKQVWVIWRKEMEKVPGRWNYY